MMSYLSLYSFLSLLPITPHPSSPYSSDEPLFWYLVTMLMPTICFWSIAGGLHFAGANDKYTGKVKVSSMLLSQLSVDLLQLLTALPRLYFEPTSTLLLLRPTKLLLGFLSIEIVEYACHYSMHHPPFQFLNFIKQFHKRHHALIPVHTLGSYYNSLPEMCYTGIFLGLTAIVLCGLSLAEIAVCASLGAIMTILDHCPITFIRRTPFLSYFAGSEAFSTHEIHHSICPSSNYSQPFSTVFDVVFGTDFETVMRRQGKDPKKVMDEAKSREVSRTRKKRSQAGQEEKKID